MEAMRGKGNELSGEETVKMLTEMNKKYEILISEVSMLKKKWSDREESERKRKLVIMGIKETFSLPLESVMDLMEGLELNCGTSEIKDVFRIVTKSAGRVRPLLVKFWNKNIVYRILNSSWKLKKTNIYINRDLSKDERRIRINLIQEKRDLAKIGVKAKIIAQKLIILNDSESRTFGNPPSRQEEKALGVTANLNEGGVQVEEEEGVQCEMFEQSQTMRSGNKKDAQGKRKAKPGEDAGLVSLTKKRGE